MMSVLPGLKAPVLVEHHLHITCGSGANRSNRKSSLSRIDFSEAGGKVVSCALFREQLRQTSTCENYDDSSLHPI